MFVLPSASRVERAPMPIDGKTEYNQKKWGTSNILIHEQRNKNKIVGKKKINNNNVC
jgi:hypothetical protein